MHPGGSKAIQRAIDQQSREIRVPVHVAEAMKKVQRISKELQQSLGREATPEEIARKSWEIKITEDVKIFLSYLQNPVSLETPVGKTEKITWEIWWRIKALRHRKKR